MRTRLFEQGVILLLIDGAGIVEDPQANGVAVAPEVFVIFFEGGSYFTQPVRRNDKGQFSILCVMHGEFR
jgi:hypothetical protein